MTVDLGRLAPLGIAHMCLLRQRCRLWVTSDRFAMSPSRPIYPRLRTFVRSFDTVAMGQQATFKRQTERDNPLESGENCGALFLPNRSRNATRSV